MEAQSPWFEGSVGDAVAKATNEKLLFLSFIYDDDENSTKMRELLSDSDISALMKSKSVAIEMKKGSETYQLFSQIFPTFFCPCLVFIQNGRLIYFLNAEATKDKVIENINKYSDLEQANPVGSSLNQNANDNSTTSPQATSPMQAAAEKAQKEKELNDKKKTERIEELKKMKHDNDARRKQILEQINNDRKERESRNNSFSNSRGNSSDSLSKLMSEKPKMNSNSNEVLISVRYLDGSLLRQEFKRNQKLSDIRKWIDDTTKAKGIFKPYSLETKYPEHQFSFGEETKTLLDLNLDDTDLLICKPVAKVFSSNPRQTLDVGKYFTSNFLKDLLLFFYAFILSFNIFSDPTKPKEGEGEGEGQGQGQNFNFKKGKIRMNTNERKMGTMDDIRGDNKKPQETYNGNSTNQQ